jgi:hypothetical protein
MDDFVCRGEASPEDSRDECANDNPQDGAGPEMRLTQNHGVGIRPQHMPQGGNSLHQPVEEPTGFFHYFVFFGFHSSVRPPV